MPPHPLVRRSSHLRSPPPRVLRRSQWLSLSSKRQPAIKLSHNERTKADWPLPKRGALFLLRRRPSGCALERDWIQHLLTLRLTQRLRRAGSAWSARGVDPLGTDGRMMDLRPLDGWDTYPTWIRVGFRFCG